METLTTVAAVSPAAPYLGGKRNLARRLVDRIGAIPHTTYVEPFVGMGGVFLRRTARPRAEVINDLSGDVATLFRVLQEHYPYFIDMLRWRLTSRAEFDRLRALPSERLTDLQRAARFLYLQRLAFGGKVKGQNFGVDRRTPGRFDVTKLEPMLAEIHERLAGVVIEQLPYAEVIRRYDGPETLFYLDPPYWGCERTMATASRVTTSSGWPTSWRRSAAVSSSRSTTRPARAKCSAASPSMRPRRPGRLARRPAAAASA